MKHNKKNLVVGLVVLGVIVLGLFSSAIRPKSLDAFYIQNAEFEKSDFRLKRGSGVILGVHKATSGLFRLNDQERLSLWIPTLNESIYEFGERSSAIGHFSKAVTDHPELSCEAEIQSGQLEILSVLAEHIKIRILASFDCLKKDGLRVEVIHLDQGYALTSKPLNEGE